MKTSCCLDLSDAGVHPKESSLMQNHETQNETGSIKPCAYSSPKRPWESAPSQVCAKTRLRPNFTGRARPADTEGSDDPLHPSHLLCLCAGRQGRHVISAGAFWNCALITRGSAARQGVLIYGIAEEAETEGAQRQQTCRLARSCTTASERP